MKNSGTNAWGWNHKAISLFLFLSSSLGVFCQSTKSEVDSVNLRIKRTTLAAAIIPGSGQIINRKYWKAPIVWAGIYYTVDWIRYNHRELNKSREWLIAASDDDPTTVPDSNLTLTQLTNRELFYRKQRDQSYLTLAGIHLLSILDAHVDANLLAFDVSDDLSARLIPVPMHTANMEAAWSLSLCWRF